MSSFKKNHPAVPTSSVRIIGGQWRGRKLKVLSQEGLRPTGDRLRETLFNWLAAFIPGARCLDAFAGSGALGFEALSRGCDFVQFIEINRQVCRQLAENFTLLGTTQAQVSCINFTDWQSKGASEGFDLVFLDPPFKDSLWLSAITHVTNNIHLNKGALIYIETPKNLNLVNPGGWQIRKQKSAGQVVATLYETADQ